MSSSGPRATWSRDAVNRLILRKHHLSRRSRATEVLVVVRDLVGLHASDAESPYLQLRARMGRFRPEELDAVLDRGLAAKLGGMRGTLFVQASDLVPIVLAATRRVFSRGRDRYLELNQLTPRRYRQMSERVARLLAGRSLGARQIRKELGARESVPVVLRVMCDEARIVRWSGRRGWRDSQASYRLFEEVLTGVKPFALEESEAIRQLVKLYLRSYGPVTERDITWWTGLDKGRVRDALTALGSEVVTVRIEDLPGHFLTYAGDLRGSRWGRSTGSPEVSLLPILDPYLQGYRDRDRYLDPVQSAFVFDRGGNATSVVLVDGRVQGVLDAVKTPRPEVRVFFFHPLPVAVRTRTLSSAAETGAFLLGGRVPVVEVHSMKPLTERGGWVVSPLRTASVAE